MYDTEMIELLKAQMEAKVKEWELDKEQIGSMEARLREVRQRHRELQGQLEALEVYIRSLGGFPPYTHCPEYRDFPWQRN